MCIAEPALVLDVTRQGATAMARVAFGDTVRDVNLAFVPDAEPGDYLVVHAGLAVKRLTRSEARATRALLDRSIDDRG